MRISHRAVWGGLLAAAWIIGAVSLTACGKKDGTTATEPLTGDPGQTVATVNGETITLGEVNRAVGMLRTGRVPDVDPAAPELDLQKKAVDDLIAQRLLYLAAKKAGTVPSDQEIQGEVANFVAQRFPSDSIFVQQLSQMNLTREDFTREFQRNTGINRYLQQAIQDTVNVTPEQARTYFDTHPEDFQRKESVRARHILVRVDAGATPEQVGQAEGRIREAHTKVAGGADFAAVAQEYSEDPGSRMNGGDLGFFQPGQMVQPFDSVAFALAPGTISDVIRTQFGFHVIKAEERMPPQPIPYEQVEARLPSVLGQQRAQERVKAYIEELKTGAKISRKV